MPRKYVVEDNDVLLSCELPSHVADFLRVTAWLDSEGHELGHGAQGITCDSPMLGGGGGGGIGDFLFEATVYSRLSLLFVSRKLLGFLTRRRVSVTKIVCEGGGAALFINAFNFFIL